MRRLFAKKLTNPIANLVSIPIQESVDFGLGPSDHGVKSLLNIQPVLPISLGQDWSVISRTILPVTYLSDEVNPAIGDQFGLGDTTQSFFFSPKEPGPRPRLGPAPRGHAVVPEVTRR